MESAGCSSWSWAIRLNEVPEQEHQTSPSHPYCENEIKIEVKIEVEIDIEVVTRTKTETKTRTKTCISKS